MNGYFIVLVQFLDLNKTIFTNFLAVLVFVQFQKIASNNDKNVFYDNVMFDCT